MQSFDDILNAFGGESRIDLGLERFQRALREVGHPEKLVKTIVIGGTNGKGTTAILIANTLCRQGLRVGTYLSPHLQTPNERLLSNMLPIDSGTLHQLGCSFADLGLRCELTYFEFLTLLYFIWAATEKFDISVLEVGLGGRLDATNVTEPLACAITNIAFDHQKYLGHTLEAIFSEKVGISRPSVPLYTGITDPDLLARCPNAKPTLEIPRKITARDWTYQRVIIDGHEFNLNNPSAGMVENAVLAYALLRGEFPQIPLDTIQSAFASAKTPGRFEVTHSLSPKSPRILLSGDHNPHGIDSLCATLDSLPPTRLHTLCAFSLDKPYAEMFARLKARSQSIVLAVISNNRLLHLNLAGESPNIPADYLALAEVANDPVHTFETMKKNMPHEDTLLVTGSLYLVGEIRKHLALEVFYN